MQAVYGCLVHNQLTGEVLYILNQQRTAREVNLRNRGFKSFISVFVCFRRIRIPIISTKTKGCLN